MIQWTLFGVNTRGICILYILPDNWFFSSYLKFVNDSFSGFFLGQSDLFLFSHVCPLFPTFVPLYSSPFFFSLFIFFRLLPVFLLFLFFTYSLSCILHSTGPECTVYTTQYLQYYAVQYLYSTVYTVQYTVRICTERWGEVAPYEGRTVPVLYSLHGTIPVLNAGEKWHRMRVCSTECPPYVIILVSPASWGCLVTLYKWGIIK